jgi:hypothetical protein
MKHLLSDLKVLDDYQGSSSLNGGPLWPDATVDQARAWSLVRNLVKKYNDGDEPIASACTAALAKFLSVNKRVTNFEVVSHSSLDDLLLGELRKELDRYWFLGGDGGSVCDNYVELVSYGSVGKGASVGSRHPDFYTKIFDGPLTATSQSLMDIWRQTTSLNPHWRNAEIVRQSRYGTRVVAGNQLSFVNKNVDIARCISKEPIINMWFQLGLGAKLNSRTKHLYGIDLEDQQPFNGQLAQLGSRFGRYVTIDLESASDSLGIKMMKSILPIQWFDLLMKLRSPVCRLPKGSVELGMVGTMGNGFTFPLQTAVYACVVSCVYRILGIPQFVGDPDHPVRRVAGVSLKHGRTSKAPKSQIVKSFRNFGVFGDDIIVVAEAYRYVERLLTLLGMVINESKTFVEGPFRESCGYDWFDGQPCRPVFIKKLRTAQDTYVAINTLNRWSAMTKQYLPNTVGYLRRSVLVTAPIVPCDEGDTAGIHVPSDLAHGIRRGVFGIWKYLKDAPVPCTLTFAGQGSTARVVREKSNVTEFSDRKMNHGAAHVCFLGGYIRGSGGKGGAKYTMMVRNRAVTYTTKHASTPCWDHFPKYQIMEETRPPHSKHCEFADWSSAVRLNLSV